MTALSTLIAQREGDESLASPHRLRERLELLDRLDAHFPHGCGENRGAESELDRRAEALCMRLEAANQKFYDAVRCDVRNRIKPASLLALMRACGDASTQLLPLSEGYDYLDALVSGVLQLGEPGSEIAALEPEMVFYQPTPVRHLFDLIARTAPNEADVLVDLGSGLGHLPMLTSICTHAHSVGIEREITYVECARQSARDLKLTGVTFLQQDVRAADLSSGTIFYLYTPFTGTIMRDVLEMLRREAIGREIRVCTYGPCTSVIAEQSWLEETALLKPNRIAVFRSRC